MRYLITLRLTPADARLDRVQKRLEPLGVQLDSGYGLVSISPKRRLYVARAEGEIDEQVLQDVPEVVGVHGDAKIAPIGSADEDRKGE